ncbi:TonB-dependent receptor [Terriglobus roseus]|uniref:Carboxypeptidase regulatory-like domain-containing protein n=1 Tax=Terriglobus roseus TaxID=392734 RepID=A0A1H4NMC0_9BACT|nr:carboxypeptidase regulatory-like domain-containing protein [Terriglobus roseus]SEB96426.1 Carboxypeptidase regulatory-like domain-containing protein [Terriglobus roseus]
MFKKQALSPGSAWHAAVRTARRSSLAILMAAVPVLALNVATPSAYGQASSSSDAAGKVTDQTGATVPGATVHLINNGTKAERTAITNDQGDWSIANIPPSSYTIRVEKAGFKTSVIPAIDVEIGKSANGSVVLAVGGTDETVEVSTLPPQLQTQEATVGQVIDQKQINDLPLNGRNVLQLATLAPGVSPAQQNQTGNPCAACGSRSLYITVDGGRASSTNYVLDGTYIRSVRFNTLSLVPNTDTLQEFNLLRSTFSTEYGQGQAVVSMVTKSGTNQIHGSGYEFARNAIFDARNYFATYASNPTKPDFKRHQFGGTLGFPIIKDKLFVFGGYEGLRSSRDTVLLGLFPTKNQLNGGNTPTAAPTVALTSRAAIALNPTYPTVASDTGTIAGGNNYTFTAPFTDNYNQYTVRGDWTVSQKSTIFGRYINYDSSQITPLVNGSSNSNPLLGRNAVLGNTYVIGSKIVNEVRVGWNEFYNITLGVLQSQGPNGNWAVAEGLSNLTAANSPRQNGRAAFTINGFTNVGDGGGDQGGHENILSAGDSISDVLGKHTLKAGFQFQNRRLWQIADNNARGAATFDNCSATVCDAANKTNPVTGTFYTKFENYARGYCTSSCNGNTGTTLGHYRDNTYGAFINDTWQVGHGLTVNAGMRWEYNSPFVEQNGQEGSLDPTTGLITFSKIPTNIPAAYRPYIDFSRTYQPGIVNPQKKGFMPRLGIAYQPNSGTVIRAGYGIYLENLNTNELQFTRYAAPLYFQQAFSNVFTNNLFPDPLTATQIPSPFSIRPDNGRPLTQEWNLSLQQDLGHGLLVEFAYTGSNTHKLWKRYDQNQCIQYPFVLPTNPTVCTRPYTQFGQGILTSTTFGASNFNGGSVKVEKRAKNGLFILGSYQWSKNLDNSSGEAGSNDSSFATNTAFDHSYSNFDVRNRAAISGGYELPFGKGKAFAQGKIGTALLGGWTLQPAVQLRTGYPFSINASGCNFAGNISCRVWLAPGRTVASSFKKNPSPFNWFDATAYSGSPVAATVTRNADGTYNSSARAFPIVQGWVTRNTGRGPGTAQVDFSAIKNFRIHERFNTQFRAEAYNIINRGIFSTPANNINTPATLGKVQSTSADNRSIQLAVKVLF